MRQIGLTLTALVGLMLLPKTYTCHDWSELNLTSQSLKELSAALAVTSNVQTEVLTSYQGASLGPNGRALDWLRWFESAVRLDTEGGRTLLESSLSKGGYLPEIDSDAKLLPWRHALEHLVLAYDSVHLEVSEEGVEAAISSLGQLDLETDDPQAHREAERLSYLISLEVLPEHDRQTLQPLLDQLGRLIAQASGSEEQQ